VVHRGVYTKNVSRTGMLWAAVQPAGRYAMLSHQSAAEVLRLGGRPDYEVHVPVLRANGSKGSYGWRPCSVNSPAR
jgi:hypothetical protein